VLENRDEGEAEKSGNVWCRNAG